VLLRAADRAGFVSPQLGSKVTGHTIDEPASERSLGMKKLLRRTAEIVATPANFFYSHAQGLKFTSGTKQPRTCLELAPRRLE
jgi:hypothetical protein